MPPTIQQLFDMTGRAAIVTGGGTHLGTAFATALAELGAAVYIASRRAALCEEVAARLREMPLPRRPSPAPSPEGRGQDTGPSTGGRGQTRTATLDVTGAGCDATDEAQVRALVERVVAERGRLDVMVCNAGGAMTTTYPPHGRLDEFRGALEMNVVSTYVCAQEAAKAMAPRRRGAIITLGSIAAFLATDPRIYGSRFKRSGPPYMAAKGGVLNLTRALAAEFGPHGITVNCISPGQVPKSTTDPEQAERFRQMNALGRTGVPDDLKGALALLASDAGAWITGQNIVVDGGWSIW